MLRVLLAATLLSSVSCFGQQGTCYTDYGGTTHCQGDNGSSGSAYRDYGGNTHYQWNPAPSQSSQYEQMPQLQRNRQVPRNDGAARLGEVLGGARQSRDAAFSRGMMEGIARRQAEEAARAAQADAGIAEENAKLHALEARWQTTLIEDWKMLGLDALEAESIGKSYNMDESQIAITQRVKRDGWDGAIRDAVAAYKAYNYQLANQLLVAAAVAHRKEHPETPAKTDDKPKSENPIGGAERRSLTEPSTLADELEKLDRLHASGALTNAEFEQAEHKLLKQQ